MTHRCPTPPERLLRAVAQDLKPVRPTPRPLQLALQMQPFAVVVSSLVLFAMGIRPDFRLLGPILSWGASGVQFVLAVMLIWIAAHESIPAGRLPRYIVYSAVLAACLVVLSVSLVTFSEAPANESLLRLPPQVNELLRRSPWIMGFGCGIGSTAAGGLLVLFFSWMFQTRSLPGRPKRARSMGPALVSPSMRGGESHAPFQLPGIRWEHMEQRLSLPWL